MATVTKKYITSIKELLGNDINTILEVQCGTEYDIENCIALSYKNINYIGVDIVDEAIRNNRQYFRNEKNKLFITLDASNEVLPKNDLTICVNMPQYLPISNIWSLLENIRDSGAKYFAFNYSIRINDDEEINEDIELEKLKKKIQKRKINLRYPPFYFPEPLCLFPGNENSEFIALYKTSEVSFFMDWCSRETSFLRAMLFCYFEKDFKIIDKAFNMYEGGKELLKSALTAETLDWDKVYYSEKYKKIVDDNRIFDEYIDFLIILYKNGKIERLHKDNPDRYQKLITEENFINASIIAKDYIKWKYNELF